MADTDLPNGYGAIDRPSGPSWPPRPIASPFGIFADPWQTPNPSQTPGFNVQPDAASTNPMASLLASLTPSRQDVAATLGAPVDALAWAAHKMGLPISGDVSYGRQRPRKPQRRHSAGGRARHSISEQWRPWFGGTGEQHQHQR
jgi:hypothetical protein